MDDAPEGRGADTAAAAVERVDPRVRRTRRMLREAALELVEERGFEAMTIRDITARADVNRATFYAHFRDKDDLVAQALDALFDEVTAEDRAFAERHLPVTPEATPAPLVALFRHLDERRPLYRRLFVEGEASAFASRLQLFEEAQFQRIWTDMGLREAPGSPPMELRARVATSMVRGVIGWWLCPPEGAESASIEAVTGWLWGLLRPLWFSGTAGTDAEAGSGAD